MLADGRRSPFRNVNVELLYHLGRVIEIPAGKTQPIVDDLPPGIGLRVRLGGHGTPLVLAITPASPETPPHSPPRSVPAPSARGRAGRAWPRSPPAAGAASRSRTRSARPPRCGAAIRGDPPRSEEHTSEL